MKCHTRLNKLEEAVQRASAKFGIIEVLDCDSDEEYSESVVKSIERFRSTHKLDCDYIIVRVYGRKDSLD